MTFPHWTTTSCGIVGRNLLTPGTCTVINDDDPDIYEGRDTRSPPARN